jgi:mono/diheme cytochrome c family protein
MDMRWLFAALAALIAAAGGVGGWVYLKSEAVLHHRYPLPPAATLPAPDPGAAARGAHLAAIFGCTDCHGDDLRGRPFPHPAPFARVTSANLTVRARRYSDADFARVIRQGLTPQGESVEFMPFSAFAHMSDADVAAIVAHIRALPAGGKDPPAWEVGWTARWQLARGEFPPGVVFGAQGARLFPRDVGPSTAAGRYLASVACSECHGNDLKGQGPKPPDLMVAGAYDPGDFHRLLKTGVAAGGRDVGMMSAVARKRFSHLTDDEVESIRLYLVARANAPP